ncbi:hypothetical protein ACFVUH_08290 [Kitasatospora sp. NPDC058032]|uniref:hypothetical protein n=1 Tax=Kitasatospora sp. NPDC058032 TaxID=3346307 RepID=UPI0036DB9E14
MLDTATVWHAVPGLASLRAVHVERDLADRVFKVASAPFPLEAMAQGWLVERGADPAAFTSRTPIGPADEETRRIEELLRGAGPGRLAVHEDYTYSTEPYDIWVIATDTRAEDPRLPVRVFHERRQVDDDTYTLREGHFPTVAAARTWTQDPDAPLPQRSSPSARAAAAARASTCTATGPVVSAASAAGPIVPRTEPAAPPPRPTRRAAL